MSFTRIRVWRSFLTIVAAWGQRGTIARTASVALGAPGARSEHAAHAEPEERPRHKLVAREAVVEGKLDVRVHLEGVQVDLEPRGCEHAHEPRGDGIR